MIFSPRKTPPSEDSEKVHALSRVIQLLLEACALHTIEYDTEEYSAFRFSLRDIAQRFDQTNDSQDLLILAGETNRTIQTYNHSIEKFIRATSTEKQLALELLSQSLLRVCHASEKTGQALRQIEKEIAQASQLQDMRELRAKLADCVGSVCREAELQSEQYRELKERLSQSERIVEPRDQITDLGTLKHAESRIKELATAGHQGYVIAFFLKNLDIVNRRFGFAAGDEILRKFAAYLRKSLQPNDQLFRWRGPCFVLAGERSASLEAVQSEAYKIGVRGPEQEVESDGKSMLIRLTAATTAFLITKNRGASEISAKIDQFAAEQFKMTPVAR